jgi:DNA invertase Pin-like site-specific DNA recombinase
MRLLAYSRTSSLNGAGQDSLDAQEDACRAWAEANGHEVVATFRDEALSGALPVEQRPGLLAALVALESAEADGLILHRIDRLARELHVQEAALAQAWAIGDHVEVIEAVEGAIKRDDPEDPHRTFLRQVLGAAAQLERGLVSARLQGGRRRKAAQGGYIGGSRLHRRYGYEVEDGEYGPVEAEQVVIRHMRTLRSEGKTYRDIAAQLEADGTPAPGGGLAWGFSAVRKILARPK